jgi:hypothetical protein
VHRLVLRGLAVRRGPSRVRLLELLVLNRGNVTETLERGRLEISLLRGGHVRAQLVARTRELRPRSRGLLQLTYRGRFAAR